MKHFVAFSRNCPPDPARLREDLQTAALETLPPTLETYGGASGEGERMRFLLAAPLSQLEEGKSTLGSLERIEHTLRPQPQNWVRQGLRSPFQVLRLSTLEPGVLLARFPNRGPELYTCAPGVWPYFPLCWAVVTLLWTEPQWLVPKSRAGWLPCSRDALICCK